MLIFQLGADKEISVGEEGDKVVKNMKKGFQVDLFDSAAQKAKNKLGSTIYVDFCKYLKTKYNI